MGAGPRPVRPMNESLKRREIFFIRTAKPIRKIHPNGGCIDLTRVIKFFPCCIRIVTRTSLRESPKPQNCPNMKWLRSSKGADSFALFPSLQLSKARTRKYGPFGTKQLVPSNPLKSSDKKENPAQGPGVNHISVAAQGRKTRGPCECPDCMLGASRE